MTKRILIFSYGVISYAIFFITFLYAIGFIGNVFVSKTIDGAPELPLWQALSIDALLLALFALQHSVMARPAFKRRWTRIIPESAERSTYVLASSLALIGLFVYWQPLGGMIWAAQNTALQTVLYSLYVAGWLLVLATTFLINHFDLFGLRQVWLQLTGRAYRPLRFVTPGPYRVVRHPLYVGWLLVFWATPTMSATHLLFAVATTLYILIAIRFEERDLAAIHPEYNAYRRAVPMLLPRVIPMRNAQTSVH
ncbi:MAG TPA: isoprenylcysteine carboxylmethyltransferase family protein [Spongiibacteraceae bacterium]|nr:isoprenylcysteine carboxylmethyltransferase family protein [Spongiibacteraceae bacterium]